MARRVSIEIEAGAGPLALSPYSSSFIHTRANASPPIPFEVGSTTVKQAAEAIAASTALPPFSTFQDPPERQEAD